jgi:CheY-like chemotaxis protein
MPIMDGLVSTSRIRAFEKENGLPASCIMAVTGVASAEIQQQARVAGFDDYLIKPVSLETLKRIMTAK